jgi:hypothetical protein
MKSHRPKLRAGLLALSLLPVSMAFALDTLSDTEMSGQVAQDGVSIVVILPDFDGGGPGTDLGIRANQWLFHDKSGYAGATDAGAIILGSGVVGDRLELTMAAGSRITASLDAVGDSDALAGSQSMLNLKLDIPAFVFKTGRLYVARSNGVSAAVSSVSSAITDNMTINVGALTANVQLGNETQGSMIRLLGAMAGGITATGFALHDANSGGSIRIASIGMEDNGASTALNVDVGVDFDTNGMQVRVAQLGSVGGGMDMTLNGVKLGDAAQAAIGNINVVGLNLATTQVRIVGH